MNSIQKRFLLFLFGCIGTRLLLTVVSAFASERLLKLLGIIAFIFVIGWLYIIFIGKRDTGPEVLGGKIWWKNLRPFHALLWALFSYLAITGNRNAWIVLFIDTIFGLLFFLKFHWSEGNFKFIFSEDE